MPNVSFTRLQEGSAVTVDSALVNPSSGVAAMSNADLRVAGVQRGTRITPSSGDPLEVQESVTEVQTAIRAASPVLGSAILRDGMPAATQTFNAAGPAPITGLGITIAAGQAGGYLFILGGTWDSTDVANCGGSAQITKNGVGIGTALQLGAPAFGSAGLGVGIGAMGLQLEDTAIVGDVYGVQIGVIPGGVGGDDITVHDVTLTAIRRT